MKLFKRYYIELILLFGYFGFLLPWCLSQPSDIITTGAFVSLAIVVYLIILEIYRGIKQFIDKENK